MTIFRHSTIVGILLVLFYNDIESQDITDDQKNGCIWQGGSIPRLLCNCEKDAEMILTPESISSTSITELAVNGCKVVKIKKNTTIDIRTLRIITFTGIQSLYFEGESIHWFGYSENIDNNIEEERFDVTVPSLKINVYNSIVSECSSHAFAGRISEITFDNVVIEKISPLAFGNLLQTEKITIKNSLLRDVGVQSFKKISTEHLELTNVTADLIPSRAFSNITVYQSVIIDNCNFNIVRSGGFTIFNPRVFQVTHTNISNLNGDAFKIISKGMVIFRSNIFGSIENGAFNGIVMRKDLNLGDSKFIFDSNTISSINPHSLSMAESGVQFRNIYLKEPCDCTELDNTFKESSYYEEMMCIHENEFTALKMFKNNMCSVISNHYIIIIVICVVITLIIAILVGLAMYYKLVYKQQKYGDKKDAKNISLIVPDGRTYRETELHVIVESTDLLTTDL